MNWWFVSMAFLGGVVAGVTCMFLWIAATIGPHVEREERRIEYWVRRDDAARNDYRSEL